MEKFEEYRKSIKNELMQIVQSGEFCNCEYKLLFKELSQYHCRIAIPNSNIKNIESLNTYLEEDSMQTLSEEFLTFKIKEIK